jgi:hypothetical protein
MGTVQELRQKQDLSLTMLSRTGAVPQPHRTITQHPADSHPGVWGSHRNGKAEGWRAREILGCAKLERGQVLEEELKCICETSQNLPWPDHGST